MITKLLDPLIWDLMKITGKKRVNIIPKEKICEYDASISRIKGYLTRAQDNISETDFLEVTLLRNEEDWTVKDGTVLTRSPKCAGGNYYK